ncbi:MnmC family methyltransferase [Methanobrevibacter acididurans]|uniref:MnmC family methyltransferase n=1 Tax=Methanobrevibacter acididurans TaxID=120963 RepID=UPI0038FCDA0F
MTYLDESRVINDTIYDKINQYFEKENEFPNRYNRVDFFNNNKDYFYQTEDTSYSIKSREINNKIEILHTKTGAISESFEKFIKPMKFNYQKDIHVLDICGGIGYNSTAMIHDFIEHSSPNTKLVIDCVEISKATLAAGLLVPSPISAHDIMKHAIENSLIYESYILNPKEKTPIPKNIEINIYIEDARCTIKQLPNNYYDAIFLDPFSQTMSPELFSFEFIKEFRRVIKQDGLIATYTSSSPVRSAFIKNGFHVGLGPIYGRKQGGTLASPSSFMLTESIPKDDEIKIALSDVGIPFHDPNLNGSTQEVTENRQKSRHKERHHTLISSAVKTTTYLGKEPKDSALKRRMERNLAKIGIPGLKSKEAFYLIEPEKQYNLKYLDNNNSRTRILEMHNRLNKILKMNNNQLNAYKCMKCGFNWPKNSNMGYKCPQCGSIHINKIIDKKHRKNRPITGNPNKDYRHHHRLYNNDDFGAHIHHKKHKHHHNHLWLYNIDNFGQGLNHWSNHGHKHFHDYDRHKNHHNHHN